MSKRQFGFFCQSTKTFIAIENEEDFKNLMLSVLQQEKVCRDQEFKNRLANEMFDDFDYVVEEIAQKPMHSSCEELREYDF